MNAVALFAASNDIDNQDAQEAYDAIVRGLPGGPAAILDELARIGMVPNNQTAVDELEAQKEDVERQLEEAQEAQSKAEGKVEDLESSIEDHKQQVVELAKERDRLADQIARIEGGEDAAEVLAPVPTKWVKTGSHRAREQLLREASWAKLDKPRSWFRKGSGTRTFRAADEYWEVPETLDVSRIKGATVLKKPVPEEERFRPW